MRLQRRPEYLPSLCAVGDAFASALTGQGTEPPLCAVTPQKAQAGGSQEHVSLPKVPLQEYTG